MSHGRVTFHNLTAFVPTLVPLLVPIPSPQPPIPSPPALGRCFNIDADSSACEGMVGDTVGKQRLWCEIGSCGIGGFLVCVSEAWVVIPLAC